jgi:hypothetical protein
VKAKRRCAALLLAAIALPALFGCEREERNIPTAPEGSFVKIMSISPAPGQPLHSGEKINLKVEVNYSLNAESGTLAIVVQGADNSGIAQNFEVVPKGTGNVTLEAGFVVPDTKAIQVFTPLSAQGQGSTSTVDSRAFKVVAK